MDKADWAKQPLWYQAFRIARDLSLMIALVYAMCQMTVFTPENFPFAIGMAPSYRSSQECAIYSPTLDTAKACVARNQMPVTYCQDAIAKYNYTGIYNAS